MEIARPSPRTPSPGTPSRPQPPVLPPAALAPRTPLLRRLDALDWLYALALALGAAFALYRYLSGAYAGPAEGRDVEVVGLDLKEDVVAFCESVARKLDFQGLCFRQGDVARYEAGADRPHLVVSLHACDTATDEALAAGIAWGCEALMAVPCCQHEFARSEEHTF